MDKDTCKRKKYFSTKKQAKHRAKQIKGHNGTKLEAYKCPYCGGWHLTSHTSMPYKMTVRNENHETARND